jgi:hypothetical protein
MKTLEKMEVKLHVFFIPELDGGFLSGTLFRRFLPWESDLLLVGCRDGWMDICAKPNIVANRKICVFLL